MKKTKLAAGLLPLMLLTGCAHLGSEKLIESRFNYTAAIGDSWKSQMLLNVVKLRYGDVPIFLAVQSVIDQHNITTAMNANASWVDAASPLGWASVFGGNIEYSNSPTVTYAPMEGAEFGKKMMTPMPIASIGGLLQAGYSAEIILRLTLHSINGKKNNSGIDNSASVDGDFYRILDLISALQASNSIGLRVVTVDGKESVLLSFNKPTNADDRAKLNDLRRLLGLDAHTLNFTLVYGVTSPNNKEIAMLTRSVMEVLSDLSAYIEVPAAHIAENRVLPVKVATRTEGRAIVPLMAIHADADKPEDAAVAVPYHGQWYWISDRDIASKSTFSFLMFLMNLVDSGEEQASPSLVLPAGH